MGQRQAFQDGSTVTSMADGSVTHVDPSGRAVCQRPDGGIVVTEVDGTVTWHRADGSQEEEDEREQREDGRRDQ